MITNRLIGEAIPAALLLATVILIGLLYNESKERTQFIAGIVLAIIGLICLEILLLQV
jgi:ascorbate-specific PTS system EIIC-type component UlaA